MLKRNDASSPLAGLAVDRVYATGWSQTGLFLQQFLDRGYHEAMGAAPSADGEPGPVVDGYLIAVGPAPEHRPADAVLVNLLSEGEVVGTLNPGFTVADDTDAPRFRGYEVPGSFHHWEVKPGAQRLPTRPSGTEPASDRATPSTTTRTTTGRGTWWCTRSSTTSIVGCATESAMPHASRITRVIPKHPTASRVTSTATPAAGSARRGSTSRPRGTRLAARAARSPAR